MHAFFLLLFFIILQTPRQPTELEVAQLHEYREQVKADCLKFWKEVEIIQPTYRQHVFVNGKEIAELRQNEFIVALSEERKIIGSWSSNEDYRTVEGNLKIYATSTGDMNTYYRIDGKDVSVDRNCWQYKPQ